MNEVKINGHLTRNAETRYTNTGKAVTSFSIGCWMGEGKPSSFFDVTFWGEPAEPLGKGDKVLINGYLRQETWQAPAGKRSKVVIVAKEVQVEKKAGFKKTEEKADGFTDDIPF